MWSVFVSLITQEYNGRVNHLSERAHYSRQRQGAGRRRAGCAQRGAWHGQLALSSPPRCSILLPNADGGCVMAAGGVPLAEPLRCRGSPGRRRLRGWRMLGRAPVASVAEPLRWPGPSGCSEDTCHPGVTAGRARELIPHLSCCTSPPPHSLLASRAATRLSALPSP